jgi:hypothetical protein
MNRPNGESAFVASGLAIGIGNVDAFRQVLPLSKSAAIRSAEQCLG